jgi:DNA polymerase-3 subunit beta
MELETSADAGEGKEIIPIKYNGEKIVIAFNPLFLMDPLRHLDSDEIYFELSDELSPGVIKSNQPFLYVIMPIRVT